MSSPKDASQEDTGILALQAFVNQEQDERLLALCLEVQESEGHDSYVERGSTPPHITLATWEVTRQELELAQSQFASRLSNLPAITTPVTLGEYRGNDYLGCCLLPEPSEALLQWHAEAHAKLAWPFKPWREMDLPGSWWPHMGLCHVAESKEHLASKPLQKLREIREVTIERIGLVSYLGPMQVLEEVTLRRTEASP